MIAHAIQTKFLHTDQVQLITTSTAAIEHWITYIIWHKGVRQGVGLGGAVDVSLEMQSGLSRRQ